MSPEPWGELTSLERAAHVAAQARERSVARADLRRLGVVHTPPALVRFALSRVEHALRDDLGLSEGLASTELAVLDPALGTGVWLSSVLARLGSGAGPRLLGVDSDAQALATARGLLEPAARERGARLSLRRANTLAVADPWPDAPCVRVVLGNPPWGARSQSRGVLLSDAWLREFFREPDGSPLRERRSGVLSDDYVRFLRWALEQARTAPLGAVVCFVTNDSYLEGPVHRGMRAALARAFDRIELTELGGGSLRSRGKFVDDALFPVRVGAVLGVFVRRPQRAATTRLAYARLCGASAEKRRALSLGTLRFRRFEAGAPWFRFRPGAVTSAPPARSFSLAEAFRFHAEGVQTNRDALATAASAELLRERLQRIARGEVALRGAAHFDVAVARERLTRALSQGEAGLIEPLAYRPFDRRFYCTLTPLCHRPRPLLAKAAAASPLCLLSTRKESGDAAWNMFGLLAHTTADSSYLSVRSACRTRLFPSHDPDGAPNLALPVLRAFAEELGSEPPPEAVVAYIAGVLGAPRFREAHREALRLDYARLPLPRDAATFEACVQAGLAFREVLQGERLPTARAELLAPCARDTLVSRRTLRRLAPDLLELAPGVQIGVSNPRALDAHVGHHSLVHCAYGVGKSATIFDVLLACQRGAMWVEAENAADAAYRAASCVVRDANVIAGRD